jgi:hypothetical protein
MHHDHVRRTVGLELRNDPGDVIRVSAVVPVHIQRRSVVVKGVAKVVERVRGFESRFWRHFGPKGASGDLDAAAIGQTHHMDVFLEKHGTRAFASRARPAVGPLYPDPSLVGSVVLGIGAVIRVRARLCRVDANALLVGFVVSGDDDDVVELRLAPAEIILVNRRRRVTDVPGENQAAPVEFGSEIGFFQKVLRDQSAPLVGVQVSSKFQVNVRRHPEPEVRIKRH